MFHSPQQGEHSTKRLTGRPHVSSVTQSEAEYESYSRLVIVIVAIVMIAIFVRFLGPLDSVPRERVSERCYNGEIKITVYKQKLNTLPISRVGILVRITDQSGAILFDKIIFEDAWWDEDVGEMYRNIRCAEDAISIGPKFDPNDYYRIDRSIWRLAND